MILSEYRGYLGEGTLKGKLKYYHIKVNFGMVPISICDRL